MSMIFPTAGKDTAAAGGRIATFKHDPTKLTAEQRGELWKQMGWHSANTGMDLHDFQRYFQSRISYANAEVMRQAIMVTRVIPCPQCLEHEPTGRINITQLFIAMEQDIEEVLGKMVSMTCHHCGYREYQPIPKQEPDNVSSNMEEWRKYMQRQMNAKINPAELYGASLGQSLHDSLSSGVMNNTALSTSQAQEEYQRRMQLEHLRERALQNSSALSIPAPATCPPARKKKFPFF